MNNRSIMLHLTDLNLCGIVMRGSLFLKVVSFGGKGSNYYLYVIVARAL